MTNVVLVHYSFLINSSVFVKHFIANIQNIAATNFSTNEYKAGYFNDTNDLTNIKFKFASGNIDSGKILMFGLN